MKIEEELRLASVEVDNTHQFDSRKNKWSIFKNFLIWHNLDCQVVAFLLNEDKMRFITIKWAKFEFNNRKSGS